MSLETVATQDLVGQALSTLIPSGSPLELYMRWACQQLAAPPTYHLSTALTVATHELARRGFAIDGAPQPMSLWTALVGPAGNGKSSAITMGQMFIRDLWIESSNPPAADPWLQADGTVSGLFAALQEFYDASRGTSVALLYEHEFSGLLASREAVAEFLCRLFDGGTQQKSLREMQRVQRAARERLRVDRLVEPQVSVLFASTEASLAPHFTEAMRSGGLFSRLWWVCPDPAEHDPKPRGAHMAVEYTAAIDGWLGWLAQIGMFEDKWLKIGSEAEALWTEAYYAAKLKLHTDEDFHAPRVRALERTKIIAVVLASMAGRDTATVEDMRCALGIMGLAMMDVTRLQLLGAPAELRSAQKVYRAILSTAEAGMNRRELHQRVRLPKKFLDEAIDQLTDAQQIVEDRSQGRVRYFSTETEHGGELLKRTPLAGHIVRLGRKPSDEDDQSGSGGKPN